MLIVSAILIITMIIINIKYKKTIDIDNTNSLQTYSSPLVENLSDDRLNKNKNFTYFEEKEVGFSNFICGDFYFSLNSKILVHKNNVYMYELFDIELGKYVKSLSKYKYIKGIQEVVFEYIPQNYLLFVEYCEKKSCNSEYRNENYWDTHLSIFFNNKIIYNKGDSFYRWKINKNGEILLYHGNNLINLNIDGHIEKIKTTNDVNLFCNIKDKTIYVDTNNIYIYFYEKECEQCYLLKEFCKKANKFEIIPNKFQDDLETINYKATFDITNLDNITMLYYILEKAFSSNQYKTTTITTQGCFGSAIYKLSAESYNRILFKDSSYLTALRYHTIELEEKNSYKSIIEHIYSNYNLPVKYDQLPSDFYTGIATLDKQYNDIRQYILLVKPNIFVADGYLRKNSKQKLDNKYLKLKGTLVYNGTIKRKWYSEVELFKLVKIYYKDALYQYRSRWLGQQSLDIFIPSLNVAIEYQGIQHYEPVKCFGGDSAFKERRLRDRKKKELCQENNIKLIEWKYDEQIVKVNLDKKIDSVLNKNNNVI